MGVGQVMEEILVIKLEVGEVTVVVGEVVIKMQFYPEE